MSASIKAGVGLALSVAIVSILVTATGLHTNPVVGGFGSIGVFIVLTIGVIVWGLSQTAAQNGYGMQLLVALQIGLIAAALIFLASLLLSSVLFPDAIVERNEAILGWMEELGVPQEQLDKQIEQFEKATPVSEAFTGAFFTVVTSLIAGAIVAIFKRRR